MFALKNLYYRSLDTCPFQQVTVMDHFILTPILKTIYLLLTGTIKLKRKPVFK